MNDCDFGLIGLAVMGENLTGHFVSKVHTGVAYGRRDSEVEGMGEGLSVGQGGRRVTCRARHHVKWGQVTFHRSPG